MRRTILYSAPGAGRRRLFRKVPIIAMTANALKCDAEKAIAAGCSAHMAKLIHTRELCSRLASVQAQPDSSQAR
jgi:CheY-like chemotaxis protein